MTLTEQPSLVTLISLPNDNVWTHTNTLAEKPNTTYIYNDLGQATQFSHIWWYWSGDIVWSHIMILVKRHNSVTYIDFGWV